MQIDRNRRRFLAGVAAIGASRLIGSTTRAQAEPPPETTTLRLGKSSAACLAPLAIAEEFLHEEGFSEVRYLPQPMNGAAMLTDGDVDFDIQSWSDFLPLVDAGKPVTSGAWSCVPTTSSKASPICAAREWPSITSA